MAEYSDGYRRDRRKPARAHDGHGRPCIVDVYDTVMAHEDRAGEWHLNITGGEWSGLLDLAEAILAADREKQPKDQSDACEKRPYPRETDDV